MGRRHFSIVQRRQRGPKRVRVVGYPEAFEVLCESDSMLVLSNPAARGRREIELLEQQLLEARTRLADARGDPQTRGASP